MRIVFVVSIALVMILCIISGLQTPFAKKVQPDDSNMKFRQQIRPKATDKFGAVAYSPSTGETGTSFDCSSQSEAENKALKECARVHSRSTGETGPSFGSGSESEAQNMALKERVRDDCEVATWFMNACGALAVGNNYCWKAASGRDESYAKSEALTICSQRCENCRIISSKCTGN